MKLVNPAGRDITTFSTEVNRCACMCAGSWSSGYNRADDVTCGCNCHWYSSDNENANLNSANAAV
ncbi:MULTISPECIES: CA_C0660 family putative sactipeptide bacteriocin [Clostridium]|uniref:CA_C0660 family putative sactipeptide bacteriocin n=1 Tax=Clostridium TaxID=1485 RepID=UPI0008240C8C|nr:MULTISPECIES: CA_C0660 family putative sactipeptide bacteriocin [Clostridium]PJI07700.1 hypothetical protein CUB90_07415 [Clostridium sp. CT7]